MFKLHVSVLNLILGDGGDAAGVRGHIPAKPRLSGLVFNMCETTEYLSRYFGANSGLVCGDQNIYFKLKHDVFLTLTKWFWCLNLTGP